MMKLSLKPKTKPQEIIIAGKLPYDLIIIGGGPAGLTAAIYSARARLRTLILEKMVIGGMATMTYEIENYPGFSEPVSGMDLMRKMEEQARRFGTEFGFETIEKITKTKNVFHLKTTSGKDYETRAIIIASGTQTKKLPVPGEEKYRGRGVSYCATCDGAFYQGKDVAVVGGGNASLEEAIFLTRFVNKVTVIHRRNEFRADPLYIERAKANPKIYFVMESEVVEISGEQMVEEVTIKNVINGVKSKLKVNGVFVYIGAQALSGFVENLVKLDDKGYINVDKNMQTSAKGVFAAGDVCSKSLRQVVTAVSDGAVAANSARLYLEENA
jgi:thioredoxin reductase (NADPH)